MKHRNLIVYIAVVVCMLLVLFVSCRPVVSAARSNKAQRVRTYESVEILPSDSLWSIAEEYAAEYDMPVREYVRELRRVNRLESDRIIAGGHLLIVRWE